MKLLIQNDLKLEGDWEQSRKSLRLKFVSVRDNVIHAQKFCLTEPVMKKLLEFLQFHAPAFRIDKLRVTILGEVTLEYTVPFVPRDPDLEACRPDLLKIHSLKQRACPKDKG